MDEEEIIGIRNLDTGIGSAGVGFVVVPIEKDREQYINDCYRTNTLTINGGKGYGYFSGVHADINVMQNIEFPTDENNRGTAVIWVKDAISQLPVIVGVLRKQKGYYSLSENQYRLFRGTETKSVEVFVDGNTSNLIINLIGDKDEPADINVKLTSENKDSKLSIYCDNEISLTADNSVNINTNKNVSVNILEKGKEKSHFQYKAGEGFSYKDEFENEVKCIKDEIDIISKKINHNSGKEPMVLGDTLSDILSEFIDACMKITVISPVGSTSTPVNVAQFTAVKNKLESIKSKISNLE